MLISPLVAPSNYYLVPSYYILPTSGIGQQEQLDNLITMMHKFQSTLPKVLLCVDLVKSFINLLTELFHSWYPMQTHIKNMPQGCIVLSPVFLLHDMQIISQRSLCSW